MNFLSIRCFDVGLSRCPEKENEERGYEGVHTTIKQTALLYCVCPSAPVKSQIDEPHR